MANYRPKSLSELNNVYDKAMRAEKAIKEGSDLLSVPENEATPQNENIFLQLENKAAQAEKNQVFDPDITNIANDFLKRYSQPEKPKAVRSEIKRPAPSIQSVYHAPAKPKQEEKQDISLNLGNDFASTVEAPAVPLHKPAPTMPAVPQPPVVKVPAPVEVPKEAYAPDIQEPAPAESAHMSTPAEAAAPAAQVVSPEPESAPAEQVSAPIRKAPSRVRITSTERSELMEEYMRVMSDDDDEPSYKKSVFSFFKKKKKNEEEFDEDEASLYEELPEDEDAAEEEIPVVAFDNSDVKYTDEYSDARAEETAPEEPMNLYDYIEADFDYDESEEDDTLDVSLANTAGEETLQEEIPAEETAEEYEEISEETPEEEITEEAEVISDETDDAEEAEEVAEVTELSEDEEDVVYPTEEAQDVIYPDAPPADMVFEDIFSVTDENKRSHTGGNWEEVFGADFSANHIEEAEEVIEEVIEETETESEAYIQESYEEYPEYEQATDDFSEETEAEIKPRKGRGFLKFLMIFLCVISILLAGATVVVTSVASVNSGKLISDRYRVFSVAEDLNSIGLSKSDLVITENAYAHIDSLYVYSDENSDAFNFGKVTANTTTPSGDYFYVTESSSGVRLINRDNSMGVIIATYSGIGGVLSIICEYYIFIAGAFLIIAVAMIFCLIIISRKKSDSDSTDNETSYEDEEDSYSGTDSDEEYEEEDEYYSDYDTDGIEEGLFSNI